MTNTISREIRLKNRTEGMPRETVFELVKVDSGMAPLQSYLGMVGMPGLTAWAGLLHK